MKIETIPAIAPGTKANCNVFMLPKRTRDYYPRGFIVTPILVVTNSAAARRDPRGGIVNRLVPKPKLNFGTRILIPCSESQIGKG